MSTRLGETKIKVEDIIWNVFKLKLKIAIINKLKNIYNKK